MLAVVVGIGGEAYGEVLADVLVDTCMDADTVEILGRNYGLILQVVDTEVVVAVGCTAADAEFVVVNETGAVEEILPVGVDFFVFVN